MIRMPMLAVLATLAVLSSTAQSVELAMQLPRGETPDPALGELESAAMDRFFDSGIVLTSTAESSEFDMVVLCERSRQAYIDWVLLLDVAGAVADRPMGSAESLRWCLYRCRDGSASGSGTVTLPVSALQLADREKRLRSLGDATAASVLAFLRSGGDSGTDADRIAGSAGG